VGKAITPEDVTTFQWVKSQLVLQVRFVEWTADGRVRHATFLAVRDEGDNGSAT
jgi:bifunctional non-homologous end joining protein LigD